MKIARAGQAEPLKKTEFLLLFETLGPPHRFILALTWHCVERAGAICRLKVSHCFSPKGKPLPKIVIPAGIRKDRKTREIEVTPGLAKLLTQIPKSESEWLFPSQVNPQAPIPVDTYHRALTRKLIKLGFVGYSSHSARRGAITELSRAGVSARVIQKVSGHSDLKNVQRYIDSSDLEVSKALSLL